MNFIKQNKYKQFDKKLSDAKSITANSLITLFLKVLVITYGFIRVFLINKYLGVSSYGVLNIMMTITPLALIFITGSNDHSIFRILKNKDKDKKELRRIINEQIIEMRKSAVISFFLVILLMLCGAFIFKSTNLQNWMTVLFILSNSIETMILAFVVPYTQWYLNAKYKNYIYESINIILSTLLNTCGFILISLFGIGIIHFNNVEYSISALYILLCVNFLLGSRVFLSILMLNYLKKKYIPWFKQEKAKNKLFKRNNQLFNYTLHLFLAILATNIIPIILFIISSFVIVASTLSGIYFSYLTFFAVFLILQTVMISMVPFLENRLNQNINEINNLIFTINFFIIIFLIVFYIGTVPFFSLIINNYINFWLIMLMLISFSILTLKTIDENVIYLNGQPQKYLWLTFLEIMIAVISNVIGFLIIFHIHILINNCLNIIFCLVISDLVARVVKYISNIYYLSRIVYKCNINFLLKTKYIYYFIYIITFIFITIFITSNFAYSLERKYTLPLPDIFSKNFVLKKYVLNDLRNVNWTATILITLFIDIIYSSLISYIVYIFDKNFQKIFRRLFIKTNLKTS